MIAYLDTHVVVWLAEGKLEKLSKTALDAVNHFDLRVSPLVLFELQYLFEIERLMRPPAAILRQLESQLDVQQCDFSLVKITAVAMDEIWTRDPFDRLIVAHARANKYSPLISKDETIHKNYSKVIL